MAADAAGPGIAAYWVYRDGVYQGRVSGTVFSDETVAQGQTYTYSVSAVDQHLNASAAASVTVTTPHTPATGPNPPPPDPAHPPGRGAVATAKVSTAAGVMSGAEPRRIGVRPTGSYWGGAGEQIDVLYGNLNYSVPLFHPKSRGGWGVTFALTYNSQIWRQDSGGTWLFGQDVGYGLGWKLLAGALTPVWSGGSFAYYLFTDSSGAEYRLDQNNGGVWTTQEGIYVGYDTNVGRLYFPDGSYWVMGCVSGGSEQDAGTYYPTSMYDTNGNYFTITYQTGIGAGWANSSARITQIADSQGGYGLNYNSDAIPHLVNNGSSAGSSESYTFSYATQSLNSPINGASYGTTAVLTGLGTSGPPAYGFQYANGELTQATTPLGATLQWQYRTFTYATGVTVREVQNRYLTPASVSGAPTSAYYLYRDDSGASGPIHAWADVSDQIANVSKVWGFSNSGPTYSLVNGYWEMIDWSHIPRFYWYTWTQDAAGNWYLGSLATYLDPNDSFAATTTTIQTRDVYGNLKQSQVYDYGSSTPTRTYNYTYLHETNSNYLARYIRNRVSTVTVTAGGVTTPLTTNYYDTYPFGGDPCNLGGLTTRSGLAQHDDSYDANFLYRGNLTETFAMATPGASNSPGKHCWGYETTGVMNRSMDGAGRYVDMSPSASTSYSLPGVLTPEGNGSLATNISYTSSWQVTSVSGPNGAQGTTTYDYYGRPQQTTIPDGAQTSYTYEYYPATSGAGNRQTATLGTATDARWKRTTLDGFGRVTRVETGHGTTTVSQVDTQYGPCGCTPIGKMTAVSQPYAPGGTPVWTSYTYDAIGRTVTATAPDGSVTHYVYQGNRTTVTDPAGKWKTSVTDAFGNLVQAIEPDPAGGSNLVTNYTYNVANQLVQVSMPRSNGTQTRTFAYTGTDMTSATNPENGTVTYEYDGSHHVTKRTDAMGQETRYTYDAYGRLTEVQHWSGSPLVERTNQRVDYYYDGNPLDGNYSQNVVGRLGAVTFQDANTGSPFTYQYSYNQAGRVTAQRMQADYGAQVFDAGYSWDNEGRMTGINYGPSYTMQYDVNGRLSGMQDGGTTVASASYGVAGEMLGLSYFGYSESRTYNSLLQMTRQTVSGMMDMQYVYQTGANNGRIVQSIDGVFNETVNYSYDALNRLSAANATNGSWGQAFTYDGFGNLTAKTVTQGQAPSLSVSYDPATNHQSGPTYDANGNLMGTPWDIFDIENRMIAQGAGPAMTYAYDPAGKRVAKHYYPLITEYYFYGIGGQKLLTMTCGASGCPVTYNVYFGGKLVKSKDVVVVTDRLGSVRANSNGESFRYYPYGEERTTTADNREKFGTYTRDNIYQDYADQRYYAVGTGRFYTPDPSKGSNAGAPWSWNKYLYVGGDPVNFKDRHGLNRAEEDEDEDDDGYPDQPFIPSPGGGGPVGGGGGAAPAQGDPLALFGATTAMQRQNAARAVANLREGCQGVFNDPNRNIGTATLYQALQFNATDAKYVDNFGPEAGLTLSQVGVVDPISGRAYAGDPTIAAFAPAAAIASTASGSTIILNAAFYNEGAAGQAITLVHELLHLTYGAESDVDIAARFGIQYNVVPANVPGIDDKTVAASRAISNWLGHDCGRLP